MDNHLLQAGQTMEEIYEKYAAKDGFLHIEYYEYSTFGAASDWDIDALIVRIKFISRINFSVNNYSSDRSNVWL